jgi:hypothetical protein
MGTRSTITFIERVNAGDSIVAQVYQQYDGYLEGVGKSLAEWLMPKIMVNGIPDYEHDYANGIGDLAAQFVHDFKNRIGYLYLYSPDWDAEEWCDYNYKVIQTINKNSYTGNADDVLTIIVTNWNNEEPFFVGKPSELLEYIKKGGDDSV